MNWGWLTWNQFQDLSFHELTLAQSVLPVTQTVDSSHNLSSCPHIQSGFSIYTEYACMLVNIRKIEAIINLKKLDTLKKNILIYY